MGIRPANAVPSTSYDHNAVFKSQILAHQLFFLACRKLTLT
jgi:hypothetical protein